MTQEQKDLLLKDLCGRLPYGVKFLRESWNYEWDQELSVIDVLEDIDKDGYINNTKVYNIEDIKPYLFPIKSMTAEQKREYARIVTMSGNIATYQSVGMTVQDWFSKNHIDYRGLIPMGLANDATDLNLY